MIIMQDQENFQETPELDFTEHWSAFNVQQEILRGLQLRQEKPKTNKSDCVFVHHILNLPSCSKSPGANVQTLHNRRYRNQKRTKKTKLKSTSKRKNKKRECSLRVIHLAEPLKRHCLNVWKNNSHTLPDFMIERLRHHIMDETPIVKIADAVNYFKKRKTLRKKRKPKPETKKYYKARYIMILCSILAYKIVHKLKKPLNISLNSDLEKIQHVVSDDIKSILQTKKRGKYFYKQDKILTDVSKKVTVWIKSVLEETTYKQMLEELEELEAEEGPVLNILDELIDSLKIVHKSSSTTDISEDNDVQSTLDIQSQSISSISSTKIGEDTESALDQFRDETTDIHESQYVMPADISQQHSENDYHVTSDDEIHEINENTLMTEHMKSLLEERLSFLFDTISNVVNTSNIPPIEGNTNIPSSIENNINDLTLTTNEKETNKYPLPSLDESDIKVDTILLSDYISDPDKNIDYTKQNNTAFDFSAEDPGENQSDIKLQSNSPTVNEKNNEEEESDEGAKKVKFSDIHMDFQTDKSKLKEYQSKSTSNEIKDLVVLKSSKDYIFSHFIVAPPNDNLLSFIDEIWPENVLPPLLKATESVNKSVTSLGRIQEIDEHSIMSHYSIGDKKRSDSTTAKLSSIDLNSDEKQNEVLNILKSNLPRDVSTENWRTDKSIEILFIDSETPPDLYLSNERAQMNREEIFKQDCGDVKKIESNKSLQIEHEPQTNKKQLSEKSCNTDITETSMTVNKKVQTRFATVYLDHLPQKNDILKWCIGLENVAANLELWAVWIEKVCLNIISLRHKAEHKCQSERMYNKVWGQLNKNIIFDGKLWSELHRSLRCGLKKYKKRYCTKPKASTYQTKKNFYVCKCNKNSKNSSLCSQMFFDYYSEVNKKM